MPVVFPDRANQDLLSSLLKRVTSLERELEGPKKWTPTIASTGTLSYTASASGQYTRQSGIYEAWFQICFNSITASGGNFLLSVAPVATAPLETSGANKWVGEWWAYDNSSGLSQGGSLITVGTTLGAVDSTFWFATYGSANLVGPTAPFAWAVNDRLSGHLKFPVALGT